RASSHRFGCLIMTSTVSEMIAAQEIVDLREVAAVMGWGFKELSPDRFSISMGARDRDIYYLHVELAEYRGMPAVWRLVSKDQVPDRLEDAPKGGGFLHSNGVICAPWNRLAYKKIDSRGPHEDWELASWLTNAHTGACTTLAAMALRIHV